MFEYKLVKNFVDAATCEKLANRLDEYYEKNILLVSDTQCPNSPSFYGAFNDESLLWCPRIEELVDKKLFPTYTYSRIYSHGEILLPHKDREECEYSFTLALKYDKEIWPICIETSEGVKEFYLDNGDILIYNGVNNYHWRMPLDGQYHYQAFFHYVDQNGPYADKKFDGTHKFATNAEAIAENLRRRNVL